jgi:transcriptional regulator with XRE-family HTH domain
MEDNRTKLRKLLDSRGLKNKYVAQQAGINENYLSSFCSGRLVPLRDEAVKLARFLGVSVPELFDRVLD